MELILIMYHILIVIFHSELNIKNQFLCQHF
jgi:hypothetical protein